MATIATKHAKARRIQDMTHDERNFGQNASKIGNDSTGALSLVRSNSYSARTKSLQLRKSGLSTQLIESGGSLSKLSTRYRLYFPSADSPKAAPSQHTVSWWT